MKLKKNPMVLLTVFLLSTQVVSANTAEISFLNLTQAVEMAFKNEEALRIAGYEVEDAKLQKQKALKALAPDLSFSSAYEYSHSKTNQDSEIEKGGDYSYTFSMNQPLYTGGRATSAMRAMERTIHINKYLFDLTREEIFISTAQSFYNVLSTRKVVEASRLGAKQAREFLNLVKARFELGEVTRTSLLRAEFDLSRRENELVLAENSHEIAREILEKIIGQEFTELADDKVDLKIPVGENLDKLVSMSMSSRKEAIIADENLEIAREDVVSARGKFLPLLYANGYYSRTDSGFPPDDNENWGVSINLDIPIYDRGQSVSDLKIVRLALEKSRLEREQLMKNIRLEVQEKYHQLEGIRSSVDSLKKQVELAVENSRGVQKQYELGLSTDIEVSMALYDLVSARVQLAREEYDLILAGLFLQKAVGLLPIPK